MAADWKTVRVFISSTFRDMHGERDHLVRVVFPELRERCRTKHVQLVDVDLRWGVTEADAEHGRALDICLDEIDGCRPYFLGILGHRYGFVPEGHRHSITAQEIYHGVLHGSAPKQVVDLRKILEGELEGRALSSDQKDCLVRCYTWDADKRKYVLREDVAAEDADIIRSVFERYSIYQKDRSFFFFRSEALSRQLAGTITSDFLEQNREERDKLESLKKEIVDAGLPHFDYADIEAFGQLVLNTLWNRIEAETEAPPSEARDWLGQEAELHELFMADRTRRFVGRHDLLDRMHGFCNRDEDPALLVITGEPGCGKSALMARFTEEALRLHTDWLILGHSVGASPSSTSLRRMLRRLCTHLTRATGSNEDAPEDVTQLLKLFPELLTKVSEQRHLLIIIDAVNQLEQLDHAHSMHWLPQMLPKNVRFVVSTLAGEAHAAMLKRWMKPREEAVTGLTAPEIRELAGTYLREIRHAFPNPEVERDFHRKVERGNPLYILVALEELRVFGTFEGLGSRINRLPDSVPDLFDQVLQRIESDFGPALVGDCLSYMACGRHGMTAEELQTLLKAHAPRIDPHAEAPKLPDMSWRRLYRSLSSYLFQRSSVIDFFHGQLKEAVGNRYLANESTRASCHGAIADYFDGRWKEPSARALDELPHQNLKARHWYGLAAILCDLEFIELKCQAAMTFELVDDYDAALHSKGLPSDLVSEVDGFARFFRSQRHLLATNSASTFQQAANEPDSSAPSRVAWERQTAGLEQRPWLQLVNKPQARSACVLTLQGHTGSVTACAFSPDGARVLSGSSDKTVRLWDSRTGAELTSLAGHADMVTCCAFSPDGARILSGSWDKVLKLWDARSGRELAALAGHTSYVRACCYSPNGRRVASSSDDATLKLWDAETGRNLATLAGRASVFACAFAPDGRRLVSASADTTLTLWDPDTGQAQATLAGHTKQVFACAYSHDGSRIVSGSNDYTLMLWDVGTGAALSVLAGHTDRVMACAFSADDRRILSASADKTLRVWDARTGTELATLAGHTGEVWACAFSPDGSGIVSASADKTLRIWDALAGAKASANVGHTAAVTACAFSPDGRRIVSGSGYLDKTLKLWNARTGAELSALTGHSVEVTCCAFSPDGSRIVSASGDNTLKLWDTRTGAELATLAVCSTSRSTDSCEPAFSPDGCRLVSGSGDNTLRLWDAKTGAELAILAGHTDYVRACCFSPDGRRIVSGSRDKTLKLWDARTGTELATLAGHTGGVWACAFSPDGSRIVSGGLATLKLWDAETGRELTSGKPMYCVGCYALSSDGRRVVSATPAWSVGMESPKRYAKYQPLKIWDAKTGAELLTLAGHTDHVQACHFSPDDRRIVSSSTDKTLKLWDAETGEQLCEYHFGASSRAVACSPNNIDLAAGDDLGRVHILRPWNIPFGPAFVTPWEYTPRRWIPWQKTESNLHFGCPQCRSWSEIPKSALGTVISCPGCAAGIKLNPLAVNADWRPVAANWRALRNDE